MSNKPTLVTDLSQLRKGDVIEVRRMDIVVRGPVGKIGKDVGSGRVVEITTPMSRFLWRDYLDGDSDVYLVSSAPRPPLPTTPGSVLTRAVIRREEIEGPIILATDCLWYSFRLADGYRIHEERHITDWTIGRVVEVDKESE